MLRRESKLARNPLGGRLVRRRPGPAMIAGAVSGEFMGEHRSEQFGPTEVVARATWLVNDPLRLAVLAVHVGGERWVGETTKLVGWSQPQVSVALRDFRVSGWMTSVRKGRYDFYSLTTLVGVRIEGPHLIVDVEGNHGERLWLVRLHGLSAALCPPNPATTPPDDGDGKDLRPSQPGRLSGEERRAAPDIVLRTLNDGSARPRPADTTGPT
jgi:hypothetical protein